MCRTDFAWSLISEPSSGTFHSNENTFVFAYFAFYTMILWQSNSFFQKYQKISMQRVVLRHHEYLLKLEI